MFLRKILKNKQTYCLNGFLDLKKDTKDERNMGDISKINPITQEKGCVGCMRSSPVASMIGMIIVLFGIGAFGGGFIIAWKSIDSITIQLFPHMEFVIYGIVVAVVFYILLSYILAALSSGYNRKRFFEGSRKARIGRCFTILNLICLMLISFIWILMSCIMGFCFLITVITYFRLEWHQLKDNNIDLSYYGLFNNTMEVYVDPVQMKTTLPSISLAFGGSLVVVIGFIQMLCCSAMNYVRLSEERYYDTNPISIDKSEHILSAF